MKLKKKKTKQMCHKCCSACQQHKAETGGRFERTDNLMFRFQMCMNKSFDYPELQRLCSTWSMHMISIVPNVWLLPLKLDKHCVYSYLCDWEDCTKSLSDDSSWGQVSAFYLFFLPALDERRLRSKHGITFIVIFNYGVCWFVTICF